MIPRNDAEFRKSLSLNGVAKPLAAIVENEVKKHSNRYCLFYHLRHVLDTSSPSVAILATAEEQATRIWQRNEKLGFHTLNHVLDSLYYPERSVGDVAICVRVSFNVQEFESCHLFDDIQEVRAAAASGN